MDAILTINAGSSSLKFSLFQINGRALALACSGQVEGLGSAPHFLARDAAGKALAERCWDDADEAFQGILDEVVGWVESHLGADRLIAVGHRVVHGGPDHNRPERVTPELLAYLDRLTPLAPLHEPHNIAPMRAIAAARPNLPQVACFDTAFHRTMPEIASWFALPRRFAEAGVQRYGFHGLSYEYIARRLRDIAPDLANGRVIAAHLGNGASLCAMRAGRSIDTTMGFSTLDGLMMGTRCGSLDAGVLLYLQQQRGFSGKQIETLLYQQSGLLGVSGIASDMRTLLASSDPHAKQAIAMFVYRVVRDIGALVSSLGGLDGLIFTGGIGEHAAPIREMICARLGWLGVVFDQAANNAGADIISGGDSPVCVRVLATNEEAMIASHTLEMIALD